MPVIFSPGEAETRPLDPEAIVYTTAQKVADLLGIGPQEAVLMSANAETNAVFVTGGDYRNIGFSVGDTILIYSDADPMGQEHAITAITTSASGVKLAFAASINPGLYETADNGYVQNTASFTNGKTRGMTRATVEEFIKRTQDRIDNDTHNAWRPTMVHAEYINFDTYKPYRRRYYTDYVGTSPLLFRNVQQVLRLEVWQGDDYRDLCGSEARLEIIDEAGLKGDSICIGMANGSVATLAEHNGDNSTSKWRADFDKVSAAQNLADLINKEDRVNKAAVEFSPAFTLEGSTSNIAVHNEILATANSDYGNGKVKITSLRQTKGGESVSIASTDLTNLSITQVTENTATSAVMATGIAFTFAFSAGQTGLMGTSGGVDSKFSVGDSVYNANGTLVGTITTISGSNIKINESTGGTLVAVNSSETLYTARMQHASDTDALIVDETSLDSFAAGGLIMIGTGETIRIARYTSVDTITVSATIGEGTISKVYGRLNGVVDVTGSFINNVGGADGSGAKGTTVTQFLLQSDIGAFSDLGGDQGRLKDWWIDYEMGIIYFNNSYPYFEWNAIKVAYIYGERYVEKAIEEAATKMVASDLLMSDDRSVLIPEGSQNVDLGAKIQIFRNQAKAILGRYKEIVVFE